MDDRRPGFRRGVAGGRSWSTLDTASSTTSSEHVYRPRSGDDASTDPRSTRDHALLPGADLNVLSVHGQRVAAFDHDKVLVKLVDVLLGSRVRAALPERHLSTVDSIENVPLDTGRVLGPRCNSVRRAFHESRKLFHAFVRSYLALRLQVAWLSGPSRTQPSASSWPCSMPGPESEPKGNRCRARWLSRGKLARNVEVLGMVRSWTWSRKQADGHAMRCDS